MKHEWTHLRDNGSKILLRAEAGALFADTGHWAGEIDTPLGGIAASEILRLAAREMDLETKHAAACSRERALQNAARGLLGVLDQRYQGAALEEKMGALRELLPEVK